MSINRLWSEKYRPKSISDYIFQDESQKRSIQKWIEERSIPHLFLTGTQGTGKTTLSKVLVNELSVDPSDVLTLNCSDENNVETVREKIKGFVTTFPVGDFKVVRMEECDFLTLNSQAVLRNLLEEYESVARFIFTANYENKIMPAIKSRCQTLRFKAMDKNDIAEFVAKILLEESVKFSLDVLDDYINVGFPDIRKIINLVEQHSIDGALQKFNDNDESSDYKFELLDLMKQDKWDNIRQLLCSNVVAEEWEEVYKFVYENLNKCKKFSDQNKWEEGIVIISDHLYKHAVFSDPHINAAAMFIRLKNI